MPTYIDISVPLSAQTTVYPGDPVAKLHWPAWSHAEGDPANVGFYEGCLHHGTHVDAPWHFIPNAKRLHEVPLDHWLGPCLVLDLTACETRVDAAALAAAIQAADATPGEPCVERLLFKTRNGQADYWHAPWDPDFIYIDKSAADWCAANGVKTVGLDYLTIDPPSEPTFPAHMALLGSGVTILENIVLRDVAPSAYELLAAPVNLQGVDGGWCRALLRSDG